MAPLVLDRASKRLFSVGQFVLVFEGKRTEPRYMRRVRELMNRHNDKIVLYEESESQVTPGNSNIEALIQRSRQAEEEKKSERQPANTRLDQFWILLDHDSNSHNKEQFSLLKKWEDDCTHHHVALSSPKFEMWLLLHFECTDKYSDSALNKHLPGFNKALDTVVNRFNLCNIQTAIANAHRLAKNTLSAEVTKRNGKVGVFKKQTKPVSTFIPNNGFPSCEMPSIRGSAVALLMEKILQLREGDC